mgnify:CR=1 FL=1
MLELNQIQTELDRRVSDSPLQYFWPHQRECNGTQCKSAQLSFETFDGKVYTIRGCPQVDFLNSPCYTKAFFGSNRSGKTTSGSVFVGFACTGRYPDWYTGRKWDRPTVGRIFAKDFSKGVKVITRSLKKWLPKETIVEVRKNNQGAEVEWYIKHKDGGVSFFDLMTYEQESDSAEGSDQDWVWFDEPPPREMYIAATRGLIDTDGICLFTLTPLKEPWLFDEVYNSKDRNVYSTIADMRHNLVRYNPLSRKMIGLSENAIRRFEEKLTEEDRETRMHGKFRYLSGRIWKDWNRDVHTYDRRMWVEGKGGVAIDGQPPLYWPRIMIIDPHDRNPHALLWVAMDDTGDYWGYREAWLKDCLIEDAVLHIKKVEINSRERIQQRVMDPNFGPKRYANSGQTVRDEFEQAGRKLQYPIRFAFGDDRKEVGRKAFALLLRYDPSRPLNILNHPKFRVASDMKEFIYQVEHYVWDEFKHESSRDPKEAPKDMNTHMPDLCMTADTELLTNFGWKSSSSLNGTEEVATLSHNKELVFQKPTQYYQTKYKGDMVYCNARGVNQLITPNHTMITRERNGTFRFKLAKDLKKADMIPVASSGILKDEKEYFTFNGTKIDTDLWAEFIGWFVSEGYSAGKIRMPGDGYRIGICQFIPENQDKIAALLNKLPFHWFFNRGRFLISNKVLWMYLSQLGKAGDKYIPHEVKNFPKHSLLKLIETMVNGDGWEHKNNRTIATISNSLKDDIAEVLVKTGKAVSIVKREQKESFMKSTGRIINKGQDIFYITERNMDKACLRNAEGKNLIESREHSSDVYCVSVPNETLLVRREGITSFTGNCHYFALAKFGFTKPRISEGKGSFYLSAK